MSGIVSYAAYIPYWRLSRASIAAAHGTPDAPGHRAVASYDEDATSMAVESARLALADAPGTVPDQLLLATTSPPYLEKTNAVAVHAALGLDSTVAALDLGASVRSGAGGLRLALEGHGTSLIAFSDVRVGRPGGGDERETGDGSAALLVGTQGPFIADYVAGASATEEFLERWRLPGDATARVWEERFGESVYLPLVEQVVADALKQAGLNAGDINHVVVTGTHARAIRLAPASLGFATDAVVDDLAESIGNTGIAHPATVLASVLDRAKPHELIGVLVIADGAEFFLFRATEELERFRSSWPVVDQLARGNSTLSYTSYLAWREQLTLEPLRRPLPATQQSPASFRAEGWKFGLAGSRCTECDAKHLPPQRVCRACHAVDRMLPERFADRIGEVAAVTVDRLAWHPSPPATFGLVEFDGGARFQCEITDVPPGSVAVSDSVEMTFRRLYTTNGVHNYFWKARPARKGRQ